MTTSIWDSITTDDLAREVRAVAAADPGRMYNADEDGIDHACVYFKDGCPSCIIGQGLARLGVTFSDLESHNESTEILDLVSELFSADLISARSLDWLQEVQRQQDKSLLWGTAIEEADECIMRNGINYG